MDQLELTIPVPRRYQDDILKNLYWIDPAIRELRFDPRNDRILQFTSSAGMIADESRSRLKETATRLARSLQIIPSKNIHTCSRPNIPGCPTPYEDLCTKGWVRYGSDGIHTYHGLMSDLYHTLDHAFRREALRMGVEECKFPAMISLRTLSRSGYLEGFPHNANLVCHLPEQVEAIESFKALVKADEASLSAIPTGASFAPVTHALSPTVCYHLYQSMEGCVLAGNRLLGATAMSPCYRYEGKAMQGLRRLREFNMREIIFIGMPSDVLAKRDSLLEVQRVMMEFCELDSVIQTSSDPFFLDNYDKKRIYQVSFDLKHEVLARLPAEDVWLAIGSVNYHEDHFGKAFNIRLQSGEVAHSCCLGFGIDRWCMAIFAQYGLQSSNWPESLCNLVEAYRRSRTDPPRV